jgi:hypothetical protein
MCSVFFVYIIFLSTQTFFFLIYCFIYLLFSNILWIFGTGKNAKSHEMLIEKKTQFFKRLIGGNFLE